MIARGRDQQSALLFYEPAQRAENVRAGLTRMDLARAAMV